jgi:predicted CXXCH cytochrome family protein
MRWILSFLATVAVFFFIFQTASGLDLVKFRLWQSAALSVAAAVVFLTAAAVVSRFGRAGPAPTTPLAWLLALGVLAGASVATAGEGGQPPPPAAKAAEKASEPLAAKPNNCLFCHGNKDVWEGDQLRLYVTEKDFARDLHWGRGLRCADCHGGNPAAEQVNEAHARVDGFRNLRQRRADGTKDYSKPPEPAIVVKLCGECHANIQFMKQYNPSPRVDQLNEYWSSGHGQRVKEAGDPNVATCVSCHGRPHGTGRDQGTYGVLAVRNLDSPVYVKNVAKTCAKCHSDEKRMAGYQYQGRPIGRSQYEEWRQSVHGKALLDKDDLSAPACNGCHGNHGALPPQVRSVANICGTCHGKVAGLFNKTLMQHGFAQVGLPGCVTCHSNHKILPPGDQMLGVAPPEVCSRCHGAGAAKGSNAALLAGFDMKRIIHGGEVATTLRKDLETLKQQIGDAGARLEKAERLGMLVPGPQSNPRLDPRIFLRKADDTLTNARVEVHSFDAALVGKTVGQGESIAKEVRASADRAVEAYHFRRIWLAGSLVPIALFILLLLLYIRRLPSPS